ncbi:methyl-accepting chemotaxis protein [Shouchella clausii]
MKNKWTTLKHWPLKAKLITAFAIVLAIPSTVIGISSYQSAKGNIISSMSEANGESLQIIDRTIDLFIEGQMENVEYVARASDAEAFLEEETEAQRTLLHTFQETKTHVEQTYVGTIAGNFMNEPTSFQNPPDYDPRERPWYQLATEHTGETVITDPYISNSSGEPVVTIAKTTADEHGVAALNLQLDAITDLLSTVSIGEKGYVFILDQNNAYVSHPHEELGSEASEFFLQLQDAENGQLDYPSDTDGENLILHYTTNDRTGWKIVSAMYETEIERAVAPILNTTLFVIFLSLLGGAVLVYVLTRSIVSPIHRLTTAAEKMSEGDLAAAFKVDKNQNDEIGRLGKSFEKMRNALATMIAHIQDKSHQLSASAEEVMAISGENTRATEQIANSMQEVATGVDKQAVSVNESAGIAKKMAGSINEAVEKTDGVQQTAQEAAQFVENGNKAINTSIFQMTQIRETVGNLSQKVEGLGQRSIEINKVADTIKSIADQTNLLALNAAIEAARAGEDGRGFSVVANEVKKLADQSAAATVEISEMIQLTQKDAQQTVAQMETSKEQVEKGIEVVNVAGESFHNIKIFVDNVAAEVHEVASLINSIGQGSETFVATFDDLASISETSSASVQNISAFTEEQLASMEEIAASVENLTQFAEELQGLVQQFDIDDKQQ